MEGVEVSDLLHNEWKHSDLFLPSLRRSLLDVRHNDGQGGRYRWRDQQPPGRWDLYASRSKRHPMGAARDVYLGVSKRSRKRGKRFRHQPSAAGGIGRSVWRGAYAIRRADQSFPCPNSTGSALSGTLSATAVNGIATFSNISVTLPGSGYQLSAISSGVTSGVSASFSAGAPSHQVDLSWNAPTSSPDPVTGYNVYRSSDGGNTYQLANSAVDAATTYVDTNVLALQSYDYYVTSVDASGVESVPSNTIGV